MYCTVTRVLALGLACTLAAGHAQAGDLVGRLLTAAAPDTLCVVHVANLEALLKKADRFGKPFSVDLSAMFPLFATSIFQNGKAGLIDRTAPVTFVILDPKKHTPPFAYVVHSADAPGYIRGLAAPLQGVDSDGDALVAASAELAQAALTATPAVDALPTIRGDLVLRVPVAALLSRYAEDIAQGKASMFEAMKTASAEEAQMSPEAMKSMLDMYFGMLQGLGSQTERVEAGVEMDGSDLLVRQSLHPIPGSKLDAFFRAQGVDPVELMGYLPKGAVMNFSFGLRSGPELIDGYLQLLDLFIEMGGTAAAPLAELRPRMGEFLQNFGPLYAGSLLASDPKHPGMRMVQFFDFQKPEGFNPFLDETVAKTMPALQDFYKKLSMPAEVYFGVPKASGLPDGTREMSFEFKELPEDQKLIFERLYGGTSLQAYLLPVGKRILTTYGPGSEELLKSWTDKLAGPAAGAVAAPPISIPGKRIATGVMDIPAYMDLIFSMTPMPDEVRAKMKAFLETPQAFVMNASVDGPVFYHEMRYPLESTLVGVRASMDAQKAAGEP